MTVTGCRRPLRACGAALAEDEARLSLGRSNGGFGRFARAWRILGIRGQRRFGFFFLLIFFVSLGGFFFLSFIEKGLLATLLLGVRDESGNYVTVCKCGNGVSDSVLSSL